MLRTRTTAISTTAISSASKGRHSSIKVRWQLIAANICKARYEEVEPADFMPLGPAEIDRLAVRVGELLARCRTRS